MNAVEPRRVPTLLGLLALVIVVGVGIGWTFGSPWPGAVTQAYALVHPLLFGAMCVEALLRRGRSAWLPIALLLVVSVLDIIGRPQVPALSGVALASGALALILVLRRLPRAALGAVALWAVSLAASLSLGSRWA